MSYHTFGHKTHFSIGESILKPKELVEEAVKKGVDTIAISDSSSINALADLTKHCKESDIKLVLGASVDVVDDINWRKAGRGEKKTKNGFWRPNLYVKNEQGFNDLIALLSRANDEDHFYMKAQITLDDLIETVKLGNVYCTLGSVYSAFYHKNYKAIVQQLIAAVSASNLLVELLCVDQLYSDAHNTKALETLLNSDIRAITSRPVLYTQDESVTRDVVNCIVNNDLVTSTWRREANPTLNLLSNAEYKEAVVSTIKRMNSITGRTDLSKVFKQALVNQTDIINDCTFQFEKKAPCLPHLAKEPFDQLKSLCIDGWSKRITKEVLGYKPDKALLPEYKTRLAYELGVIKKMNFSDYFLLVYYLVNWSKENGIIVGPGRGSVGGSLIAFLIGITDVDPIRFDLIFERFINPERIDLPDIDLDFMSSRRQEAIEQLVSQFGRENVAGISNYTMLGAASSLRAVAKSMGLHDNEYACSKLVPKTHGQSARLEDARDVPEIDKFANTHADVWNRSIKVQDTFRNYGKHAAGIVVAGEPITNRAVLEYRGGEHVINWDKRTVEDFGLIKLDILGLTTLDVLGIANEMIEKETGKKVDFTSISLEDEKILKAFALGDTKGVFQFEGGGVVKLLKSIAEGGDLTFDDIVAATALFRPGPIESGLMDDFVSIKQGNSFPSYPHDNMIPALESTNSVIIYQEQVMKIARDLAGFSMAESDKVRKIMGKKQPEEMAKLRDKWVEGCVNHSQIEEEVADKLFSQIEAFAGYAFNKSHSVEYALISYWMMYLKVYHKAIFYAATMTVLDDIKIAKDAAKNDIHIVPPDINHSTDKFEVGYDSVRKQTILYAPFQMIKGVSKNGAAAILRAKAAHGKPFKSKQEFIDTVERRLCNVRVQAALDKVGAFAEIEGQIDARHPDRLKDQKELIASITVASIRADRKLNKPAEVTDELRKMVSDCRNCNKCALSEQGHPTPRLGRSAKVMIITDCPNFTEAQENRMGEGDASNSLRLALSEAGLSWSDVYLTSLVKGAKTKGLELTGDIINACSGTLDREIELLKPAVILTLGSKASRYIEPELKGGWEEICGEERYLPKLDATLVVGLNPMMVHFDISKQDLLDAVCQQVANLIT